MVQGSSFSRFPAVAILTVGLFLAGSAVQAQTKPATMPDAQIEANVLKALAGAPELADQLITSTTVYGTVTLNGQFGMRHREIWQNIWLQRPLGFRK